MPPGRTHKRPGESDGDSPDGQGAKCKLPRLERGGTPNDFSSVVKSKLSSYTRTGQVRRPPGTTPRDHCPCT